MLGIHGVEADLWFLRPDLPFRQSLGEVLGAPAQRNKWPFVDVHAAVLRTSAWLVWS